MHVHICIYIYINTYIPIDIYIHTCSRACTCTLLSYARLRVRTYVPKYGYMYMSLYMHICKCICICMRICIYTHLHIASGRSVSGTYVNTELCVSFHGTYVNANVALFVHLCTCICIYIYTHYISNIMYICIHIFSPLYVEYICTPAHINTSHKYMHTYMYKKDVCRPCTTDSFLPGTLTSNISRAVSKLGAGGSLSANLSLHFPQQESAGRP